MAETKSSKVYNKWELITRKWWFFFVLILMQFLVPPYAAKGFELSQIGELTGHILTHSIMYSLRGLFPVFQVIAMLSILGVCFFKDKVSRCFSMYAALSYILFAALQNISITEEYGLAVLSVNIVMFVLVAVFWFWEALIGMNDFSSRPRPFWRYWVIPVAFLAFWFPLNQVTFGPDFNPIYLFTSGSALTFCLMTPVYLAVLAIFHPRVNLVVLRITSLIGIIIGFYNMLVDFVIWPSSLWWNGVLHTPLVILSVYSLVLSFRGGPTTVDKGF